MHEGGIFHGQEKGFREIKQICLTGDRMLTVPFPKFGPLPLCHTLSRGTGSSEEWLAVKGTMERWGLHIRTLLESLHKEKLDPCLSPHLCWQVDCSTLPRTPSSWVHRLEREAATFWDSSLGTRG